VISSTSTDAQLECLHNAHAGETAYLVACGPSTGQYREEFLRQRLANELVIAVKQAMDLVPGIADYHLINAVNRKEYDYTHPRPIVMFVCEIEQMVRCPMLHDVYTPRPGRGDKHIYVSQSKDFDSWTLDKIIRRPLGPTIVFTLGMFLAVHLGVSRIITLGVDMAPEDMRHYYPSNLNEGQILHSEWEAGLVRDAHEDWDRWLRSRGVRWLRAESDEPNGFPSIEEVSLL